MKREVNLLPMSLLQKLKAETQGVHRSLENKLNLLDEKHTKSSYCNLLKSFYGYYRPFERQLSEVALPISYGRIERLPHLIEDLKFLGLSNEDILNLPECELKPYSSHEELYGALYVIEGSALGGQVLTKHFGKKFGFTPDQGLCFFFGLGAETFPHWKKFQDSLEKEFEKGELKEPLIIQSAILTFKLLEQWLRT